MATYGNDMDLKTFGETIEPALLSAPPVTSPEGLTRAAALVLISRRSAGACFGFIHRPDTMDVHPGQISFPGGHMERGEGPLQTALRETEEEIGVNQNAIDVIGFMPPEKTGSTGYIVWPVVGVLIDVPVMKLKEDEADDFFWCPVSFFLDTNNRGVRDNLLPGERDLRPAYHFNGYEIWGLTLRIITTLLNPI
ncbi:Uncharacterized Nudix hydrolase NudL [hydrothermal vent metagenome]|uniref:Uncharacterized Nudix hydrolase NudL n=1 Tax=hydrothermal vent metagenome TaxID=652676 RepID=A0A3B1BZ63_9ZZZZ